MKISHLLDDDDFAHIVRNAPLVSIDIIIIDPEQKVLVGLRTNEPARGTYFVPGGVIRKNETMRDAFARIVKAEIGLNTSLDDARFIGAFEHFYQTNRFRDPNYGTHYVVLAYELKLQRQIVIVLDPQHSDVRWFSEEEILSAENVHSNTKAYFR